MTTATPINALLRIPLELLDPGPNARGELDEVTDLQVSIAQLGILKPLLVTEKPGGRYEVLDGHRRRKAASALGLPHVLAVLRRPLDDRARLLTQVTLHTHAAPFAPIAEAHAIQELRFTHAMSREEIAQMLGRSPGWVRDRLALLNLSQEDQAAVARRELPIAEAVRVAHPPRQRRPPSRRQAACTAPPVAVRGWAR